ncbi:hypothetical protein TNCV_3067371 [Trichonephila clavipes]|nr:hypothetical protein TNCV_3067371 [Trichonephila clavipes]
MSEVRRPLLGQELRKFHTRYSPLMTSFLKGCLVGRGDGGVRNQALTRNERLEVKAMNQAQGLGRYP